MGVLLRPSSARGLLAPVATCQRLRRDALLLNEQVDKGLHGLHFLVRDELVVLGHRDKVDKAHVENVMLVNVPEGVQPVRVVQVGVASEHLLHDALAILVERLREATGFANPLLPGSSAGTACFIDRKGVWYTGNLFRGEHNRVVNLADNPFLNTVDELGGRDLSGTTVDQPGVGQAIQRSPC